MIYSDLYINAKKQLDAAEVESSAVEASLLFEYYFNISKKDFVFYRFKDVPEKYIEGFLKLVSRRCLNEPLQYILGEWEFMGLKYEVGKGVLIPRDDTEVLVKKSLDFLKEINLKEKSIHKKKLKVLDLCSGTGIIAITLSKRLNNLKEIVAVDFYDSALFYLKKNIKKHSAFNVSALKCDVLKGVPDDLIKTGPFNLIVSNPPYILSDEIANLQKEVKKEPITALDGGSDGLKFYKSIFSSWKKLLCKNGGICVEIGRGQAFSVLELFKANSFGNLEILKDINGVDRVVFGTLFN